MIRLIKNGRVINPADQQDSVRDLWIDEQGRISNTPASDAELADEQVIDATDCWVIPGLVDLAAHFREPGEEHKGDIRSESAAALAGGVTTVCLAPNTNPVIDTPAVVELIQQRTHEAIGPRLTIQGAMSINLDMKQLSEMGALKKAGCIGVSNGNRAVNNNQFMRNVMDYAASYDLTVFLNPIDDSLGSQGCAHEGVVATRMGLPGIPVAAETAIIARDLALIEATGVKAHFCRLSSARSIEMIVDARQRNLPVTADVSTHQLFLTENDILGFNSHAHVRPPLRTERDKDALRQAVKEGAINAICSDHQPHEADAKHKPFAETEPGMSTIETLLPLTLKLIDETGISPADILRLVTCNPANILGIEGGKLDESQPADITVIDPNQTWILNSSELVSQGKNTSFENWSFQGKVIHTLTKGKLVYTCR